MLRSENMAACVSQEDAAERLKRGGKKGILRRVLWGTRLGSGGLCALVDPYMT